MHKIDIRFKPSKLFILFVLLSVAACFALVFTLPVTHLKKFFLCCFVLTYGGHVLWDRALLQHGHSLLRMSYDGGTWQLQDRIRTWQAEICGESTITSFLSILRFTAPNKRKKRTCLVFKEVLGSQTYRQLIVILRNAKIH
jgi:hypothetical protein